MSKKENNYYVYIYLREDGTPYYVGKGRGRRAYDKSSRKILPPADKTRIVFTKQNLTEEEAFKHEIELIAFYGRKNKGTGILRNLTDGGEGVSGAVASEETRKKISDGNKGHRAWNKGCSISEETRKKISNSTKGEKNHRFGKKLSEETRRKISNTTKGRPGKKISEETRKKIGDANRGKSSHNKGVSPSEETRKKLSEALKKYHRESKLEKTRSLENFFESP